MMQGPRKETVATEALGKVVDEAISRSQGRWSWQKPWENKARESQLGIDELRVALALSP